jgi:hypothetical protein
VNAGDIHSMVIASDYRVRDPRTCGRFSSAGNRPSPETIELRKIVYMTNQIESINFQL